MVNLGGRGIYPGRQELSCRSGLLLFVTSDISSSTEHFVSAVSNADGPTEATGSSFDASGQLH